jgi:citrate lyase subunit beta/citryl-CoA lyase
MTTAEDLAAARTLLFVPGHRPDRFATAAASGADVIILDLEDAVAPRRKERARENVARYLDDAGPAVVRVNAAGTPWHDADLAMLGTRACAVMLPKAADPHLIEQLTARLRPDTPIIPLIETASGVLRATALCACPGVARAAFGSLDLAAQLGVDPTDRAALQHAQSMIVLASASAGLPEPIDGVTTTVTDDQAVRADADHGRRLGFTAKMCIHPHQLAAVRAVFTPSAEQQNWARAVLAAADGSATVLDGHMIDQPVVARARRLLAAAADPTETSTKETTHE